MTGYGKFLLGTWRMLNSVALPVAFFSPWILGYTLHGPGELPGSYVAAMALVPLITYAHGWRMGLSGGLDPRDLIFACFALGVFALWGYTILNAIRALTSRWPKQWPWLVLPLLVAGAGLIVITLTWGREAWGRLLWGYWLTWAGIVSSLAAEIHGAWQAREARRHAGLDNIFRAQKEPA
jgi:hypothetical protein